MNIPQLVHQPNRQRKPCQPVQNKGFSVREILPTDKTNFKNALLLLQLPLHNHIVLTIKPFKDFKVCSPRNQKSTAERKEKPWSHDAFPNILICTLQKKLIASSSLYRILLKTFKFQQTQPNEYCLERTQSKQTGSHKSSNW